MGTQAFKWLTIFFFVQLPTRAIWKNWKFASIILCDCNKSSLRVIQRALNRKSGLFLKPISRSSLIPMKMRRAFEWFHRSWCLSDCEDLVKHLPALQIKLSPRSNAIDVILALAQPTCGIKWLLTDVKKLLCKYRAAYHLQLVLLLACCYKHAERILCVVSKFIMKNLLRLWFISF